MNVAGERAIETDGRTLGERIVEAARLAVAVHLFQSLATTSEHYGQQFGIGGAGPVAPATADRARARRPFRISGEDGQDSGEEAGRR
jgi:hypothetical protein